MSLRMQWRHKGQKLQQQRSERTSSRRWWVTIDTQPNYPPKDNDKHVRYHFELRYVNNCSHKNERFRVRSPLSPHARAVHRHIRTVRACVSGQVHCRSTAYVTPRKMRTQSRLSVHIKTKRHKTKFRSVGSPDFGEPDDTTR